MTFHTHTQKHTRKNRLFFIIWLIQSHVAILTVHTEIVREPTKEIEEQIVFAFILYAHATLFSVWFSC